MAIPRRVKLDFDDVFPHGLFLVGDVEPAKDFERSTKDKPVQAVDDESGLPVYVAECVDADPAATKNTRSLAVRIAAEVQPVPPESTKQGPFKPVAFEGLTGTPWVEDRGNGFTKISWSFRATGFAPVSPGAAAAPSASENGSAASESGSGSGSKTSAGSSSKSAA